MLVDEMGVEFRFDKGRMGQESLKERDGRFDAADLVFVQGPAHSMDGMVTIFSMGDDLRNQRIIVRGYTVIIEDMRIHPNPGSAWRVIAGNCSR